MWPAGTAVLVPKAAAGARLAAHPYRIIEPQHEETGMVHETVLPSTPRLAGTQTATEVGP